MGKLPPRSVYQEPLYRWAQRFNRLRHVPLVIGTLAYWGLSAWMMRQDVLIPLLAWGWFIPLVINLEYIVCLFIPLACVCSPMLFVYSLAAPLIVTAVPMSSRWILLLSGLLVLNGVAGTIAMLMTAPGPMLWLEMAWFLSMALVGVGCITSRMWIQMFRHVLECEKCGYPLRPSVEAGTTECPECGTPIAPHTFTAVENLRAREMHEAQRDDAW